MIDDREKATATHAQEFQNKDVTITINHPNVVGTTVYLTGTVADGAGVKVTVLQFFNGSSTTNVATLGDVEMGSRPWSLTVQGLAAGKHHGALAMAHNSNDESGVASKRFKTAS